MSKNDQDNDLKFIQSLAKLLTEKDLTELQITRDYGPSKSLDIHLSRQKHAAPASAPAPTHAAPAPSESPAQSAPAEPAKSAEISPNAITSPMVGTVYLQAEPDAPAFVSVGAKVKKGDTLLIIEAMKTMNPIAATKNGTVAKILVDNGAAVEFGTPLLIIE